MSLARFVRHDSTYYNLQRTQHHSNLPPQQMYGHILAGRAGSPWLS